MSHTDATRQFADRRAAAEHAAGELLIVGEVGVVVIVRVTSMPAPRAWDSSRIPIALAAAKSTFQRVLSVAELADETRLGVDHTFEAGLKSDELGTLVRKRQLARLDLSK